LTNNIFADIGTTLVSGSAQAIYIRTGNFDISNLTLRNNNISNVGSTGLSRLPPGGGSSAKGIFVGDSTGTGNISNLIIRMNDISGVKASILDFPTGGAGAYGILINHASPASGGQTVNAQILYNNISNLEGLWAHAIGLEGNTPNAMLTGNNISYLIDHKIPSDAVGVMVEANPGAGTITIQSNIFGNAVYWGVENVYAGTTVNAILNWWRSATGPGPVGPGNGNNVSTNVTYEPWLLSPTLSPSFSDVPLAFWGYPYVEYLKYHSVSSGYPDGTFKPNNQITRAEVATFVVRGMGYAFYTGGAVVFSDVQPADWFYPYVMTAWQNGVVSGYPDGTFKPNNLVTRTEISVMVKNAKGLVYTGSIPDFSDVPPSYWGYPYIMAVKQNGIVSGYPDGTFKPYNQATRTETSVMITKMMMLPVPPDTTPPIITITSPTSITYTTTSISLTVSADEPIDTWLYSLNSAPNVSFTTGDTITVSEGVNTLIVYANDSADNWNSSSVSFTVDTTPPASVTAITNISYANTFINWTWTDPADSDFARVMVYIDGISVPDVLKGQQFYNATGFLFGTTHNISTHTVDTNGNINPAWKNHSAKTDWQIQVCAPSFTDVLCSDWYYPYTEYLLNHEIALGYPDGTYRPGNNISRADLVSFIVNATNKTYTGGLTDFSDVPPTHGAYQYIMAAVQAGIVSGYPDGTFRPDNSSKRAETSVMISKAWNLTYTGSLPAYSDVPPSHWAYSYVMALKQYGIVSGGTGAFRPDDPTTRAEASVMVTRATLLP